MNIEEIKAVISENDKGCILKCWIQPRSSRNSVVGIHGDSIKIALTAPPVDGKANKELTKFLAKFFKISKSSVCIISGESSRNKSILLDGISRDQASKLLCK